MQTYSEVKQQYFKNFTVDNNYKQFIDYLEEHQADSLLQDFMQYQLDHYIAEDVPF